MQTLSLFVGDYGRSPRPTRMADLAAKFGNVIVCSHGTADKLKSNISHIPLGRLNKSPIKQALRATMLLLRNYKYEYWPAYIQDAFDTLKHHKFDRILCHDLHLVPLACALKDANADKNTKITIDLREFYPRQFEQRPAWKLLVSPYYDYLCHHFLSRADVYLTVSPGLVDAYKKEYAISCELIPSLSYYQEKITPHPTALPIKCIHHGNASSVRKLEHMIEGFAPFEGKYTFDLMLVNTEPEYLEKLRNMANNSPHINVIAPVPMPEIVSFVAKYDVGVYLSVSNNFNEKYGWPNKLFEYIQARLGVIISPSPDMSNLVNSTAVGCTSDDYSAASLSKLLSELNIEKIDNFKQKSHEAAKIYSWEENEKILIQRIFS